MDQNIELWTSPSSFNERTTHYIILGVVSSGGFGLIFWFSDNLTRPVVWIICCALVFSYVAYRIWEGRFYLIGFKSNSDKVEIRYLDKAIERTLETTLKNVDAELRNTTSRYGFNCEVVLKIDKMKFTVDRNFDWTFADIGSLFEYIRHFQDKPLMYEEKFTLRRIAEKEKKN